MEETSNRSSKYTLTTKRSFKYLFWCLRLSQIGDLCQYLEGPISAWNNHDKISGSRWTKYIPIMVLPYTDCSFQELTQIPNLWQSEAPKKVLGVVFVLRVYHQREEAVKHHGTEHPPHHLCQAISPSQYHTHDAKPTSKQLSSLLALMSCLMLILYQWLVGERSPLRA